MVNPAVNNGSCFGFLLSSACDLRKNHLKTDATFVKQTAGDWRNGSGRCIDVNYYCEESGGSNVAVRSKNLADDI